MKAILYLLPAALLTIAACKKDKEIPAEGKDNTRLPLAQANIEGKWQLVKYFISDGANIQWEKPKEPSYLTFNQDGTLREQGKDYTFTVNWRNPSDTVLSLYKRGTTGDTTTMRVILLTKDQLTVSGSCYEGCSYYYVRIGK